MSGLPLQRILNGTDVDGIEESRPKGENAGDVIITVFTNLLLFMLIFGMSATVNFRNLKRQLRNKYAIITGICMQFIIMPLIGFLSVISFKGAGLSPAAGITLLIVTASPGGSYSNWWCSLFNADLALSVAMTALSTILSIGLLPANLMLYAYATYGFGGEQNVMKSVDFGSLFISLGIVITGIVSGLFASYRMKSATFQRYANNFGSISGIALVIFSGVFSSTSGGPEVKPWNQEWGFYIGVASPCIVGLMIANAVGKLARLTKPERVTLSVECCYQNVGIATSAALSMFQDPKEVAQAMVVPLFYGLLEMIVLGLYCLVAWKLGWTKAPPNEKICVVLSRSFEVDESNYSTEVPTCDDCKDIEVQVETVLSCTSSSASSSNRTPRGLFIKNRKPFSSESLPIRKNTEETEIGNDDFMIEQTPSTSSSTRRRKLFPNRSAEAKPNHKNRIQGSLSLADDKHRMINIVFSPKTLIPQDEMDDDSKIDQISQIISPCTSSSDTRDTLTPTSSTLSTTPKQNSTLSINALSPNTPLRRVKSDLADEPLQRSIPKPDTPIRRVKSDITAEIDLDGTKMNKDNSLPIRRTQAVIGNDRYSLPPARRRSPFPNHSQDDIVLPPLSPRPPRIRTKNFQMKNGESDIGVEVEFSSSEETSC